MAVMDVLEILPLPALGQVHFCCYLLGVAMMPLNCLLVLEQN
jgi:hypothetical protein